MARITIKQLSFELETARVECERLRTLVAHYESNRTAPKAAKPAYVPPAPTPEQLARREAMAAAKALAMATGRPTLVS